MNNPETIATYRTQKTQDEDKQNIKVEKPEGTFRNRNNAETTNKKTNKNQNKKKQKKQVMLLLG
jgi:2-methylcitrate dehydratase PrpD